MTSDLTPENVASRSFSHSLRGYDPAEVRTYLENLADQLRRVQAQYLAARQQLGAIEDGELEAQIDTATTDINEVLQAARIAAEQLRDRAAREATATVSRADEAAASELLSAQADAEALRKAAWDTSTAMLEQVRAEYARLRQQADRDALAIVGEAEREAHKKIATARRDSESKVRSARLEAERLLVDARAARDELIANAERAAEAAQERTAALERRREQLMAELEELRLQREAPPEAPTRGTATTVRVVPSGTPESAPPPVPSPAPDAEWLEEDDVRVVPAAPAPFPEVSETVRVVSAPEPEEDEFDVDAEEIAGEVARMHEEAADAETADEPVHESDETPEKPATRGRSDDDFDLAKAWSSSDPAPHDTSDDLGSLFRELRVDAPPEEAPARAERQPAPDEVSEDTPLETLMPVETVTAFELRDRSLLPITNRVLRDVKRQIADVQNLQLEALRADPAHWQPDRSDLESRLSQELVVVQREAFAAGHTAVGQLRGTESSGRPDAPAGETDSFISALFDEVVLTVQAGREAGHGARDLGSAVSRVYRVWRTDEAERRMRHLASRAYHSGVLRAFADAKVGSVRIDVHGSCTECAAAAEEGISVADDDVVPVHEECRCTIVEG